MSIYRHSDPEVILPDSPSVASDNKKGEPRLSLPKTFAYAGLGASVGQTSAQAPQSVQISALITYLSSPSLIASTGHSSTHAAQFTHSSLIKYAMSKTPFSLFTKNTIPNEREKGNTPAKHPQDTSETLSRTS